MQVRSLRDSYSGLPGKVISGDPSQQKSGAWTKKLTIEMQKDEVGANVAARAGFEPTTHRSNGIDSNNAPPRPTFDLSLSAAAWNVTRSADPWRVRYLIHLSIGRLVDW